MYTPFDMMRKRIKSKIKEPYFLDSMINNIDIIEKIILSNHNINSRYELEEVNDLYKRKEIINEFLNIEDFYEFIVQNSNISIDKRFFSKVNSTMLYELSIIKDKGFDYIQKVWNLSPR